MTHENCIPIYVSGEWREVPLDLWNSLEGPKPPMGFINNGCTLSPDTLPSGDVWPACVIHDWHYSKSSVDMSRLKADYKLGKNVYKCLRYWGARIWRALPASTAYSVVVMKVGSPFFKRSEAEYAGIPIEVRHYG